MWLHVALPGQADVVRLLVVRGAEVDCKDKQGFTPLHAAASSGMAAVLHHLLGLGVPVREPAHTLPQ